MADSDTIQSTDADTEGASITFDGPEVGASFRVNQTKRTISGLVIPWNEVAYDSRGISKWRFMRDSLHWSEEGRVKLNLYHDRNQPIGRAVRLQSTQAGLDGTFAIARGEEGDRVLSLAEDGILDGFSVEPYFEDGDAWSYDEADRSIRNVRSAKLQMVGLVPGPAFDDARVSDVIAAQARKGLLMGDEKEPKVDKVDFDKTDEEKPEFSLKDAADALTERHAELTRELSESIGQSVGGAFKTMFEDMDEQRGTVKSARWLQVTEEPVYRMTGSGYSLIHDVWYASKEHDEEARERIRKFHQQQQSMARTAASKLEFGSPQFTDLTNWQFGQDTTSASDVIPPGYRPDLFVPLLAKDRPLANLLSRGSISNATPFVVPQFGTISTALTGDHSESSPPTSGAFTLSAATVTPVAVSGKQEISREIIDSSNPGIDQIVLAALREDYARQTEQKVYTELNTNNTAGDTFAAATVTQDIRDEMDGYVFTRFASPTGGAVGATASAAISADVDTAGRPFVPYVGAQNAYGMGSSASGGWPIDGVMFNKAWAVTGGSGNAEVLIVNRADAFVWESPTLMFRFEEKQGPEIIEMALFGYFATKVLRVAGVVAQDAA